MSPFTFVALTGWACSGPPPDFLPQAIPSNSATDTASNLDTGTVDEASDTGSSSVSPHGIAARLSDTIVTVIEVTWETETATTGYVDFGETSNYGYETPATNYGTTHSRLLLGMPGNTEVHYRVVTTDGTVSEIGDDHSLTTGALPTAVPTLTTTGTSVEGFRLLTVNGQWVGILIVDAHDRIVWYYEHTFDDLVTLQSALSTDGAHLIFNSPCHITQMSEYGSLLWVTLDGAQWTQASVAGIAHDFVQASDGTVTAIVQETREVDGYQVWADRLVEVTREGDQTEIWNAWDAMEMPTVTEDLDWTHANAINFDEEEDAYYVGMTNLSTIFKIDRSTGEIIWQLGGESSDFAFSADSEQLTFHHNFDIAEGLLTIFVNGEETENETSRVVQYEIDEDAMIVSETWRYISETPPWIYALGDASMINEATLNVTFSTAGYIEQVEGNTVTWSLQAPLAVVFGYTQHTESLYP